MKVNSLFSKIKKKSNFLKKYDVNYSDIIFVIYKTQIKEMKDICKLFIKLISEFYKTYEYHNSDLSIVNELKNLPNPALTFSPIRFDFLLDINGNLILSDINLPGSFVPDLFWPFLGIKESLINLNLDGKSYTCFNAYHYYHNIIIKYFKEDYRVIRFLDKNTTKPNNQRKFLKTIYDLINELNFIKLKYNNKEIYADYFSTLDSNYIVSLFLNTHNSPKNLMDSIRLLFESKKPIFVNPKLLPFTDKKPPSLEILKSILKDNEAEYLNSHLPRIKNKGQKITKRRFGHSSSSSVNKVSPDITTIINRDVFQYPVVNIEKLETLSFQGFYEKKNYSKFLFEVSLNTFITTKEDSVIEFNEYVSVSSRGSVSHPISGPHTLLFPTMVEV